MKFFLLATTLALASLLPATAGPGDATTTSIGVTFCFGQGLRCIADTSQLIRFGTQVAVGGTVTYPKPGDCAVHLAVQPNSAGGCHGNTGDASIACGKTRYYQVFYRDPMVLPGCPLTST